MPQAAFSGDGRYTLDIDAALASQSGLSSTIYWRLLVIKRGTTGHRAWGNTGSRGSVDSHMGSLWANGNMEYNFQNGAMDGTFTIAEGTFVVQHRADGTAEYAVNSGMTLVNLGSASAGTGWRSLPRIQTATIPGAPAPIGLDELAQTSMRYRFSGTTDGGSPIREWQIGYSNSPSGVQATLGSNGTSTLYGLKPGLTYYFWSRGRNDIGWGPWSSMISARTRAGARVKIDGVWKEAAPWVKLNGVWRLTQPHVKINGAWKKSI